MELNIDNTYHYKCVVKIVTYTGKILMDFNVSKILYPLHVNAVKN